MAFQLDTNIPLMAQAPRSFDPMAAFAGALQLRGQVEANRALAEQRQTLADQRRMLIEKAQREEAAAEQLRGLTSWTPETVYPIIGPEAGAKVLKGIADFQTAQLKSGDEVRGSMLTRLAAIKALPESMRPEAWDLAVKDYAGRGLIDPKQIGTYSPELIEQYERELLGPEKTATIGLARDTFNENRRHNETTEAQAAANAAPKAGSFEAHLDGIAARKGLKSGRQLDPRTVLQEKARWEAAGRAPQSDNQPLVAVMGPDGKAVLVPRSQAVGKTPANIRETGRQVTSGDAGRLAELDTSLDDIGALRSTLTQTKGATGAAARVGVSLPNVVTEVTGWGSSAKQRQATIDRVKQVIGKALEGGVLRKEDEYKYEKILPTIGDPNDVAMAKLDGLERALRLRKQRELDSLENANYDVSRYRDAAGGALGRGRTQQPAGGNAADPLGILR
jgi:hypothetical protein